MMKVSFTNQSAFRVVVILAAVHAVLALGSARRMSLTWDEPSYIGAGYQFLTTGNPQIVALQLHPPLSYYLNSLPFLPLNLDRERFSQENYVQHEYIGLPLIFESDYPPKLLILLSRLPSVLLSTLLGILLWRWSRKLYGEGAGLLTLFLYAFSPVVLANASLATPDILLALTTAAALFLFHAYLLRPSIGRLCLSGLALGLALLSKFTALILLPTFAFVLILHCRKREACERNGVFTQGLIGLCGVFCIAFLALWAGYGFQFGVPFIPAWLQPRAETLVQEKVFWRVGAMLAGKGIRVPAYSYILGIYTQLAAAKGWKNNFLFGRISQSGWWYYYWLAFLIKNTIPFLLCLAAGLLVRRNVSAENEDERLLLYSMIPMVVFFSLPTKINIGIRYLLPLFPLLFVAAGRAALVFREKRRYVLVLLCLWQVGAVAWIHPHYLAYFNEMIGGPSNGYKYLVDSNLDWGQELDSLAGYLKQNNIQNANIRYFGPPGVLAYYGLRNIEPEKCGPGPGIWAVSATYLQGVYLPDRNCFGWLKKLRPKKVLGYSIFIYQVADERTSGISGSEGGLSKE